MFGDPEEKREKKIRKIMRNAAFAVGGGVGLWLLNALYPYEKEAENMARLFGSIAGVLIAYGLVMVGVVMVKRKLAIPVNLFMIWIVLPTVVLMLFMKEWPG